MTEAKRVVRFIRPGGIYVRGDVAGFPAKDAAKYVEGGSAVYIDEPKPAPKGAKAKAATVKDKPKDEKKEARAPKNRRAPKARTK